MYHYYYYYYINKYIYLCASIQQYIVINCIICLHIMAVSQLNILIELNSMHLYLKNLEG